MSVRGTGGSRWRYAGCPNGSFPLAEQLIPPGRHGGGERVRIKPRYTQRIPRQPGVMNLWTKHDLKKRVRKGEEQDERDMRGG